jgi:tight adherence protein B
LIKLISVAVCFLVASNIWQNPWISIPFCIAGWIIPSLYVKRKIRKRVSLFEEQLSDLLDLLVSALRSGQSFGQGLESAVANAQYPISKEFKRLLTEMMLGIPTARAMQNLQDRIPSEDLEMMVAAYLIQHGVGGSLSEVLDNVSHTIRERAKVRGEIRTLTAQGRLSGIVVGSLPMVLCFLIFLMNREYMSLLFVTPLGRIMLAVGFLFQIMGALIIRKIVRIDY